MHPAIEYINLLVNVPHDTLQVISETISQPISWLVHQPCHGLSGSAGLKMPISAHFLQRAILTCKLGQSDLFSRVIMAS